MSFVAMHKEEFEAVVAHLKQDMGSLRTGRANTAIVEDISIEAYGGRQQVKGVGSISILDAKTIVIDVWDKGLLQAVELGIRNSGLGISPVNDGKVIRVTVPDLTSDRRAELIKVLAQKLEAARISIRQVREDVKKAIEAAEKDGEMGEDDKFAELEDLDLLVREYNDRIKQMGEDKEKDITTI